jgi:hypothetical protein
VAPPIEIRTKTVLSVPIRFAHEPPPDSGRGRGDRPALLEQSAIRAPRPAAALSRRARTCHDAGRKGRHDRSDFSKKAAPTCRRSGCRHWNRHTRPVSACSSAGVAYEDHIGLHGDKPLRQHLRPPGSARLTAKPEQMGSARSANTRPTTSLSSPFMRMKEIFAMGTISESTRNGVHIDRTERINPQKFRRKLSKEA